MKTLIKNAEIVTTEAVLHGANLLCDGDRIAYIGKDCPSADRVIDAEGNWLIPGFIDIHCHGGDGCEFMDATAREIEKIADFHLSHGTTTLLATTLSASEEETHACLENISEFLMTHPDTNIKGVHLEGPYFNPLQCGAQDPEYIRAPRVGELSRLKESYPFIMRVSAAPEIEGCMELGDEAKSLGILASAGHTDADFATIELSRSHGYTLMTHLYSGMNGVVRKNSFRVAGAVEAGLYFDDLYVEIIADGCHLPRELLRYIYKIKGSDRICLITDAIRAAGMPDGARTKIGSMKSGLDVIVEDGVAKLPDRQSFAGSTATADRLFGTMLRATGCSVPEVSRMASATPARVMGFSDRGEIAIGKRADLIIATIDNGNVKIKNVLLGGMEK